MHNLLIIPGLGDDVRWVNFEVRNWEKKYNIKPHVIAFGWKGEAKEFKDKFEKILNHVDELLKEKNDVSVLGISAGGSAAVNIFSARKNKIKHAVSVCGRVNDVNIKPSWRNKENYSLISKSYSSLVQSTRRKENE